MKTSRAAVLLLIILCHPIVGQEICNNTIDDDGDELIDLNDASVKKKIR